MDFSGGLSIHEVLIIQGEEVARRLLSRALREAFVVTRSPSVDDAIGLLRCGHRFDAILCDLQIDGEPSGAALMRWLEENLPWLADRVVFVVRGQLAADGLRERPCVDRISSLDEVRRRLLQVATRAAA